MLTILWWVLGSIGAAILLLFFHHVFRQWRLQSLTFEFLAFQDMKAALGYIDKHPQLLTDDAEELIRLWLDRAWARGEANTLVSGAIRLALLGQCREQGVEAVRQTMADKLQPWLVAIRSPSWQRALAILGKLATEGKASGPLEEMDEELVEAMSQIMALLRPLADEETIATQDMILDELRGILQQKAEGTLPPSSDTPVVPSPPAQTKGQKGKRRRK